MTGTRVVALVTLAYLALCGAVMLAFRLVREGTLPLSVVLLCAAPLALYALVGLRGADRDLKQFVAKTVASFGMLPVLLLMWGASRDDAPLADAVAVTLPAPPLRGLDEARLFAGALAVQDVPLSTNMIERMRSAAFADGTDLRLTRFRSAELASRSLEAQAGALDGKPMSLGPRRGTSLAQGMPGTELLVYVEQHGHELVEVRGRDGSQVLARLEAQHVPVAAASLPSAPAKPAEVASSTTRPVWPFAVGFAVVHALAFVGFIVWAGARTTRVPASTSAPVSRDVLEARLASLRGCALPCEVAGGDTADELVFDYRFAPDVRRAHRMVLRIDVADRKVRVREVTGASGAAPRRAEEADMRPLGSVGIDPTRPKAQKIWARTIQTSFIDRAQLATVPLTLEGPRATLPHDYASTLDPDGVLHVLCAVVTRSGYAWQPVFLASQA